MRLSPLPTTVLPSKEEQDKLLFPYPEIDRERKLQENKDEPILSAFLKTQEEAPQVVPAVTSEEQRMLDLENMLSEAQNRAAVIEQEAYDKAYAAGEKSGLALGEKRAEQILQSMETVLKHAEKELKQLQNQSVDVVTEVAQSVVEYVLGQSDEHVQKALEHAVNQALDQFLLGSNEGVVLAVNPQDLNMFARMSNLTEDCKLKAQQSVEEGTCRLISSGQDVLIDPKHTIQDIIQHIRERFSRNE